jgi:hypothetical protein
MVPMTPIVEKKTILFGSKKDCHISSFVFLSYTILWMFWKVMMPNFFHVVEFDKPWNWLVRICHKNGQQQDRLNTQKHLFSFFSLSSSIFLEMSTVFNQQFSISSRKKCANAYSFHIRVFHGYMPQNLKHKLPMYTVAAVKFWLLPLTWSYWPLFVLVSVFDNIIGHCQK